MSPTYYNEIDTGASCWLARLAEKSLINPGIIDPRDIRHVKATDVVPYDRCHFFAGVGGWDLALRMAGWPEYRRVWTGSCPCQPYSVAGTNAGDLGVRNLWPEFRRLIAECLPPTILGEQVASPAGRRWVAGVRADLEALGYAVGIADLCAASVGAPHIRQRLYWVADHQRHGLQGSLPKIAGQREADLRFRLADVGSPGWPDFDVIECLDGKRRRIEPGTFPLVNGLPSSLVRSRDPVQPITVLASPEARGLRLKGYGNAIVPQLASRFITCFLETTNEPLQI